jgi:putative hemolysin
LESESYHSLLSIIPLFEMGQKSPYIFESLCLLFILLLTSSVFSGFKSACFSFNLNEKKSLEDMISNRSGKILSLLSQPDKLIATISISTTIFNFLFILFSIYVLNEFEVFSISKTSGIALQILIIFPCLIVFTKILPQIYAPKHAIKFALINVYLVIIASFVLSPIVYLLLKFFSLIKYNIIPNPGNLSIDELSKALDNTSDSVTEDRNILLGIVNFSNIEVSDVMKPRMDVVSADSETGFPELIEIINDSGYSRIPVFTETFDNIRGILYVKDLLPFLTEKVDFKWQDLIRPAYFVPQTKKIKDLLQEFLEKKIHMAIVVDEYGGTEGIVTLEDVLEEIVGEITDESDEVESFYTLIDDYNYIFDGKILLNDFFKIVQIPEDIFEPIRGEADTLAGLILEIKGEIPVVNETIPLKNFSFTVLSVDDRRIKKLKFTLDKNFKIR